METIAGKLKRELTVVEDVSARIADRPALRATVCELSRVDWAIRPASWSTAAAQHKYWRIVAADFVTTDSGSGIVHQAPAFGEVDYEVLVAEQNAFRRRRSTRAALRRRPRRQIHRRIPDDEGHVGQGCRQTADSDTARSRAGCCMQEQYLHEYPFCWRASEDPLIQYPRRSWFIRTTKFRDLMLQQQRQNQLAAGAYPRWSLRQLPGIECRLGAVARTLLGNAAADLGLPRIGQDGSDRQLRRIARQAGRHRHRGLGRSQGGQSGTGRRSCESTNRTSTRSLTTRRSPTARGCNA